MINEHKPKIEEGKLRCQELHEYLTQSGAGLDIWLSEDGSGIIPKIEYDAKLDQLVGMCLPMDENGIPKKYDSTASDVDEIQKFMEYPKSTLVYLVLATPLNENVSPFVLQIYGTNNRFKTTDVIHRWEHTIKELKR